MKDETLEIIRCWLPIIAVILVIISAPLFLLIGCATWDKESCDLAKLETLEIKQFCEDIQYENDNEKFECKKNTPRYAHEGHCECNRYDKVNDYFLLVEENIQVFK